MKAGFPWLPSTWLPGIDRFNTDCPALGQMRKDANRGPALVFDDDRGGSVRQRQGLAGRLLNRVLDRRTWANFRACWKLRLSPALLLPQTRVRDS